MTSSQSIIFYMWHTGIWNSPYEYLATLFVGFSNISLFLETFFVHHDVEERYEKKKRLSRTKS